ncbi:MAG: 2-oxoacid:acceptor oxidoreductase family protein [Deltaproteobacteria bacterium]|nr:2-oxoacid:acceptor oxidoreductase family protein [Deltaproteobacteria bacterium]
MPAKYPGIRKTADGSDVVVWVETHISQGACAYPITPSTNMGQGFQAAVANGNSNLWNEPLVFLELESEHSSASSCEGFALAGGRVANFTSGQGLILMKEVLYTISGKRLPCIFHIGARALTSQSLNIHAGHDDVMGVADTGWGMLFAKNAQEACDFALISRKVAEKTKTPFMNIQDGFLTTHTLETVFLPEKEMMKEFIGAPQENLFNFMNPSDGLMTGVVQNQDSYMKGKIAQRFFYDGIVLALRKSMKEFSALTGRSYGLIDEYKVKDAEYVVVGLGSAMETAMEVVGDIRQRTGQKIGVLNIVSFRPFPTFEIVKALRSSKAIAVLERLDIPLMQSNPLTSEIKASFADAVSSGLIKKMPHIHSGVYGLGGRDTRHEDFEAVFKMLCGAQKKNRFFSLGIKHKTALKRPAQKKRIGSLDTFSLRGHSIGGYGSITTNKILATLVSDLFNLYVQAFPKYGSEKKGLPTNYYLSIAKNKIRSHCELTFVDYVALNNLNVFRYANPLDGLCAHRNTALLTTRVLSRVA